MAVCEVYTVNVPSRTMFGAKELGTFSSYRSVTLVRRAKSRFSWIEAFLFEEGSAQQWAPFELDRYLAIKASELASQKGLAWSKRVEHKNTCRDWWFFCSLLVRAFRHQISLCVCLQRRGWIAHSLRTQTTSLAKSSLCKTEFSSPV